MGMRYPLGEGCTARDRLVVLFHVFPDRINFLLASIRRINHVEFVCVNVLPQLRCLWLPGACLSLKHQTLPVRFAIELDHIFSIHSLILLNKNYFSE